MRLLTIFTKNQVDKPENIISHFLEIILHIFESMKLHETNHLGRNSIIYARIENQFVLPPPIKC